MAEQQIIEVEADTLEEARKQIKSRMPEGLNLISEEIISDGKPKTVKAIADTSEAAFAKAQAEIPAGASILAREEEIAPGQKVLTVEAFDEEMARAEAASQSGKTEIVKTIKLTTTGKPGFLGMGKKPNQYEAGIFQPSVVIITYKTMAKIAAKIGRIYSGKPLEQVSLGEILKELQKLGESEQDAAVSIAVAEGIAATMSEYEIRTIHGKDTPPTVDDLALRWAVEPYYKKYIKELLAGMSFLPH